MKDYLCIWIICGIFGLSHPSTLPLESPQDTAPAAQPPLYLITLPSVVVKNSTASTCVSFHDLQPSSQPPPPPSSSSTVDTGTTVDATIVFKFKSVTGYSQHIQTEHFTSDRCLMLSVPDDLTPHHIQIEATVIMTSSLPDRSILLSDLRQAPLYGIRRNTLLYSQLDRPVYQPADTVNIRVMALDTTLRPKRGKIDKIWIEDPEGHRLREWIDLDLHTGFTSVQFKLARKAVVGEWTLTADMSGTRERVHFLVRQYVLPRFQTTVNTESHVAEDTDSLEVQICARYTYNKNVSGEYHLSVCDNRQDCQHYSNEISGCVNVTLQQSAWSDTTVNRLTLHANVTDISGETHSSERVEVLVDRWRVKVDARTFVPKFYTPGQQFYAKMKAYLPSGAPAAHALLLVEVIRPVSATNPRDESMSLSHVQCGTDGMALSAAHIPQHATDTLQLQIREMPVINMSFEQLRRRRRGKLLATADIRQWYSGSETYLQIQPISKLDMCATRVYADVVIQHRDEIHQQQIPVHYKVMTNGNIQASGSTEAVLPSTQDTSSPTPIGGSTLTATFRHNTMFTLIHDTNTHRIPHNGYITAWSLQIPTGRLYSAALHVWRPVRGKSNAYRLIATTNINGQGHRPSRRSWGITPHLRPPSAATTTYQTSLVGNSRIRVMSGDRISLSRLTTSRMRYSYCRSPQNYKYALLDTLLPWIREYNFEPLSVQTRFLRCASITFEATVEHSMTEVQTSLSIDVPSPLTPRSSLMVYYVAPNHETIIDTQQLDVEPCLPNQITADFSDTESYPGEDVTLTLSGHPGSHCMVGVTDDSVQLLKHHVHSDSIEASRIQNSVATRLDKLVDVGRKSCRTLQENQHLADALSMFKDQNMAVMTNARVDNRPCPPTSHPGTGTNPPLVGSKPRPPVTDPQAIPIDDVDGPPGIDIGDDSMTDTGPEADDNNEQDTMVEYITGAPYVDRRFYFPETWIWTNTTLSSQGSRDLVEALPHTITQWTAKATCLHETHGVGVAPPASITAFQPFFLQMHVPRFIRLLEEIPMKITINSYLDSCFEVHVTLEDNQDLLYPEGLLSHTTCLCGRQSEVLVYRIIPLVVNEEEGIPVTVTATTVHGGGGGDRAGGCEGDTDDGIQARDTVTRNITVKPQGIQTTRTTTELLCRTDSNSSERHLVNTSLPDNLSPGSATLHIAAIGDVMGPSLSGIETLIGDSSASIDDVMSAFATNLAVLDYMNHYDIHTDTSQQDIIMHLDEGYQQHLSFRAVDHSYKMFSRSRSDRHSCVWLTAFVIKSLSAAEPHIYVDHTLLNDSLSWLWEQQAESGCFYSNSLCDNAFLQGGMHAVGSSTALSAFVATAALHAGVSTQDPRITSVFRCLRNRTRLTNNPFALALVANAYTAHGGMDQQRADVLARDEIADVMVHTGGHKFYKMSASGSVTTVKAFDIELTAYLLNAMLEDHDEQMVVENGKIVRWLTAQRNARGGFKSTQDTVAAIEALAKYGRSIPSTDTALSLRFPRHLDSSSLSSTGSSLNEHVVHITRDNHHMVTKQPVHMTGEAGEEMEVTVEGTGCVLLQSVLDFHTLEPPVLTPEFNLHVHIHPIPTDSACSHPYDCYIRRVEICVSYTGIEVHANYSRLELELVSGWRPTQDIQPDHHYLHAHDLDEEVPWFYFVQVDQTLQCIEMIVEDQASVYNRQNASAKIYHHYEGADSLTRQEITYGISEVCTEEEKEQFCLPDITPNAQ